MPKDTKTLGNNKARACESLGFVHKKRLCQRFDTTSQIRSFIIYLNFEQVSCTVVSFFIKFRQFLHIPFNPVHHNRLQRTNDDNLSFVS